jgi:hypothetical protein
MWRGGRIERVAGIQNNDAPSTFGQDKRRAETGGAATHDRYIARSVRHLHNLRQQKVGSSGQRQGSPSMN